MTPEPLRVSWRLETSQTTYLFNRTAHNLLFLQRQTILFTSVATKTSCLRATASTSRRPSTSVTSKHRCWDYTTSLTTKWFYTSMARTATPSSIAVRQNLFTIIGAKSSSMLSMAFSINHNTHHHSLGQLHPAVWV